MSAQVRVALTNLGGGKTLACQLVDLVLHVIGCVQVLEPLRSRERERERAPCQAMSVRVSKRPTEERQHVRRNTVTLNRRAVRERARRCTRALLLLLIEVSFVRLI
jgi:hypothetical protein